MQTAPIPPHIIAAFLTASRQHFGLTTLRPAAASSPAKPGRLRPMLRSLALIGSLGTALAQPALAAQAGEAAMTTPPSVTQEECKP